MVCRLGRLSGLKKGFHLAYNMLSGSIPSQISNVKKLGTSLDPSHSGLTLDHNNLTGPEPIGFSYLGHAYPVSLCYNHLTWVQPATLSCTYEKGMCDRLSSDKSDRDQNVDSSNAVDWYFDENAQCTRCPPNSMLLLIVFAIVFVLGIPLAFWGG